MQEYEFKYSLPECLIKNTPSRDVALQNKDLYTIKNLNNAVVYIWLNTGEEFWYYIKYCTASLLIGYLQEKDQWIYMPLKIDSVEAYY